MQAEYGWLALAKAYPLGLHRVYTLFISQPPHIYAHMALQVRLGPQVIACCIQLLLNALDVRVCMVVQG